MSKYNLKKDPIDQRDKMHTNLIFPTFNVKLPNSADLRKKMPPIFDQSSLGSCTSNAGVAATMYIKNIQTLLSRLFLYYKERELEGTINEDSGACMRDICKALNKFGVCEEQYFPYDITKFTNPPTPIAIENAQNYKITSYHSLLTLDQIKQSIALRQKPVLIGMNIYESFESQTVAKTGIVPMPNVNKEKNLGGHAVLICGYVNCSLTKKITSFFTKQPSGYLIVRNSWGSNWGDKGYFYLPYEFITKRLAYDFWTIES